jgi:hypothetical protein
MSAESHSWEFHLLENILQMPEICEIALDKFTYFGRGVSKVFLERGRRSKYIIYKNCRH